MIFDMVEIETSNLLATSANANPYSFNNPIAIRALIRLAALWGLPLFNSSIDTPSFLHVPAIYSYTF